MISVIMPVYNTGEYLREAFESLIDQTFREFEIICVNDTSDDEYTNRLLNEFQQRDNRINVIWLKENVGAGEARNIGFANAKGEYVIFLDADDIFRADMLEIMHNKIIEENADVCFCGNLKFCIKNGKKIICCEERPVLYIEQKLNEDAALYISHVPWDKLCKAEFLRNNNIYFQSLSSQNDVFYSYMVNFKSRKQCKCDDLLVEHRIGTNTQISAHRNYMNFLRAMELVLLKIKDDINEYMLRKQVLLSFIMQFIFEIKKTDDETRRIEFYTEMKKFLLNNQDIVFSRKIFNYYYNHVLKEEYDKQWVLNSTDFYFQLQFHKDELMEQIKNYSRIILWGNGKRGEAFQRFCKNNNLNLTGITDSLNKNVGQKTQYGFIIIDKEQAYCNSDLIVACNNRVYESLNKKIMIPTLNLQDYCPLF